MQADKLISKSITSIHPDEDGKRALELMDYFRVNHLAVVKNNFYLGIVSDKEINNWNSSNELILEHMPNIASPHVLYDQHLFDIIEVLAEKAIPAPATGDECGF